MMKRSLTRLASAAAALTIVGSSGWAADNKQDVRVVNTAAEAVPVAIQGTATVTGGVQVTNTPTVGLDPARNGVQIVNPATAPVRVVGNFLLAIPATAFSVNTEELGNTILAGPEPSTRYAITSVTATNTGSTITRVDLYIVSVQGNTCALLGHKLTALVPPSETVHLAFPQPYVLTNDSASDVCLIVDKGVAEVAVAGYKF
jgi:hypothetical protein